MCKHYARWFTQLFYPILTATVKVDLIGCPQSQVTNSVLDREQIAKGNTDNEYELSENANPFLNCND